MCWYCETKTCKSCTTDRGSTNCLHCEQHDEYTFKWNYCPMCGVKIKKRKTTKDILKEKEMAVE